MRIKIGTTITKAAITHEDFDSLLDAARKAVEFGYTVYILPNPKGIRTADFIFVQHGIYRSKSRRSQKKKRLQTWNRSQIATCCQKKPAKPTFPKPILSISF